MKQHKRIITLPTIRKFREAIEKGKIGNFLIRTAEECNADNANVKCHLKNRPWIVTFEVKRIHKK